KALAAGPRVVALGEIGLDFYRDRQPRSSQTRCLRQQLELAVELKSPVIFHIRDAYEEFLRVIGDYPSLRGNGVMHCFSGTWDIAGKCLDLGFYLSVPGTVTFSKAETQQQVARNIPLDRLLVETDAPYLTPVPYRGKVNEPAYVRYTAQKIAELRNSTLEEIAHETTANARRVFSIQ
ncbi:MAG TPA: TatD family hydrolase, partial [Syntrophobacteraceae bacterium]|nr:TatD family hydrolase [Syntrophobacteraceae bacterium]